jgi:hypothetical protein
MYKNSLIDYAAGTGSVLIPVEGEGDPIAVVPPKRFGNGAMGSRFLSPQLPMTMKIFSTGARKMNAAAFLRFYHDAVASLPPLKGSVEGYLAALTPFQAEVFYTLIPFGASVKAGRESVDFAEVLDEVKNLAAGLIQKALARA